MGGSRLVEDEIRVVYVCGLRSSLSGNPRVPLRLVHSMRVCV